MSNPLRFDPIFPANCLAFYAMLATGRAARVTHTVDAMQQALNNVTRDTPADVVFECVMEYDAMVTKEKEIVQTAEAAQIVAEHAMQRENEHAIA